MTAPCWWFGSAGAGETTTTYLQRLAEINNWPKHALLNQFSINPGTVNTGRSIPDKSATHLTHRNRSSDT